MAYVYEINTDFNIANITVRNCLNDGELAFFELTPNEGYVMYDETANDVEYDEETDTFVPTIYYSRLCYVPPFRPNWVNNWTAVLESEVPADHISGDNEETI